MTEKSHEAKGWASTKIFRNDGVEMTLTERSDEGSFDAAAHLLATVDDKLDTGEWHGSRRSTKPPVSRNTDKPAPIRPDEIDDVDPEATGDFPRDWGLVDYMPKASELSPNDTLKLKVEEYKYIPGEEIRFYKTGADYPSITHNMSHEYPREQFDEMFKGWEPKENQRLALQTPIILDIKCSGPDKTTSKGNPYRNIVGATSDRE